jgi:hypothetical protein
MTDKDFVKSIYPTAYFTRGAILTDYGRILWEDEYGRWAREWNDPIAIKNAWNSLAIILRKQFLKKLES